jgi:cupin fold WbuC family metalloprotein
MKSIAFQVGSFVFTTPEREMQNVFHNTDDIAVVGPEWIERLKRVALASPLKRARICLHRSDDDKVHEMIIALAKDCLFRPHRHLVKNESFHMIEGRLAVVIFNDDGTTRSSFVLAPPGQRGSIAYRLGTSAFHAVLPLDDVVVYHETTDGPFVAGEAIIAPWAPSESEPLEAFLRRAAREGGIAPELLADPVGS